MKLTLRISCFTSIGPKADAFLCRRAQQATPLRGRSLILDCGYTKRAQQVLINKK